MGYLNFDEILQDLLRDLDVHGDRYSADEKDMVDLVLIVSTVSKEEQNE